MSASAILETYNDVKNLGKFLARTHSGRDVTAEEALTLFDDAFLEAYNGGWKPDNSTSFSTWVRIKTYYKILDCRTKALQHNTRFGSSADLNWALDPRVDDDDRRTIYQVITKGDARRILEHLAANRDHYEELSSSYEGVRKARKSIRSYLRQTYAWSPRRIAAAMREISTYLKRPNDEQFVQLESPETN